MNHAEKFSRLARRALEPDVTDDELMKLAEELVALKREMRVEHGLDEGSMSPEEEVQRQFARLKSLRSYLDLDD